MIMSNTQFKLFSVLVLQIDTCIQQRFAVTHHTKCPWSAHTPGPIKLQRLIYKNIFLFKARVPLVSYSNTHLYD